MNLIQRLSPQTPSPHIPADDDLLILRDRLLQYLLISSWAIGIASLVPQAIDWYNHNQLHNALVYIVALGVAAAIAYLRDLPYTTRAYVYLVFLFVAGLSSLLERGAAGEGRLFMFVLPILSVGLLGVSQGIFTALITLITTGVFSWPYFSLLAVPGSAPGATSTADWLAGWILFSLLTVIGASTVGLVVNGLNKMLEKQRVLTAFLKDERSSLEKRVQERTTELSRRASELETASRLARDISTETDLKTLLNRAVDLIRSQFGFYHAGIFLLDESGTYAELRAATSEGGKKMLANKHRLKIGETGIVGHVAHSGEPRISLDVGEDFIYFNNPFLPETHSEMALPLQLRGQIIGVLDVQSTQTNAFTPDDVNIMQTIADQLAVAIEKAQLVEQLQTSLADLEQSYQVYTGKSWAAHLQNARRNYAYRYAQHQVQPLPDANQAPRPDPEAPIVTSQVKTEGNHTLVTIPIRLRGLVLGTIDFNFNKPSVSQMEVELLEDVIDRLALSLENARLIEQTDLRAERERKVLDITSKIRSATNLQDMLAVAASELQTALGADQAQIKLKEGSGRGTGRLSLPNI
ncbi:MAG: GAF domain-containing protein [Chloroflexi bacterium]|nr:GAF domain-containing protein [Chloroflexota bacterium]